jgi:hypothetical protein
LPVVIMSRKSYARNAKKPTARIWSQRTISGTFLFFEEI